MIIDDIKYEITNSTSCKVVGYEGDPVQVVIPEEVEINGKKYKVTSIGYRAFYECYSLTSIHIPDSVTSIGGFVFSDCKNLTSIHIPDSVTSIGIRAFEYCANLTSIHIPDSVTSIGDVAFYGCENLTSIDLPSGITSLGDSVFEGCKSLTSIALPSGITSLGDRVFYGCENLTSIDIPDSVTCLGDEAFYECYSLTSIHIPESVKFIGKDVFAATDISHLKKEGTYLHFIGCNENDWEEFEDAISDDEDAISLDEWLQVYNRKKELNEFAVNAIIENVKENCPNGEFLEVTNIGTDCCELSLIFDDLTLWKSVFKTEELQDNLGLIKEKAANYKAVLELKNETGGKYLKLTGLGTDCCELSLISECDGLPLWKSVFKTEELQDNLGLIKEKVANYEALYEEAE